MTGTAKGGRSQEPNCYPKKPQSSRLAGGELLSGSIDVTSNSNTGRQSKNTNRLKLKEPVIKLKFVCAVWGDAYTNTFLNVCLPSMLSEGKIDEKDLGLIRVCDTADEVCALISEESEQLRSLTAW